MESGSWIASIFGLGAIFGGFAAGYLGTKFGQRKTMFILVVPDIVAWIFIIYSIGPKYSYDAFWQILSWI